MNIFVNLVEYNKLQNSRSELNEFLQNCKYYYYKN